MTSLFKRFKKNIPTSTTKGSPYYRRENALGNIDDLKRVLLAAPEIPLQKTEKEITFNNIPLRKITPEILKDKFGNPANILKNEHIDGHTVMFYREGVSYYKFLIQYHFINHQFFFAANKISTTGVLSDNDKRKIIDRICKKYLDRECDGNSGWQIKVTDPYSSIIHTLDDVYFHLYYLAGNDTTRKISEKYSTELPGTQNRPTGFKESLDQYI